MKQRNIYYRRKKDRIVIEGIKTLYNKKKKVYFATLPNPKQLILDLPENASFFKRKNKQLLLQEIVCLDFKPEKKPKPNKKVRVANIMRTQKKDGKNELKKTKSVRKEYERR